MYIAWYLTLRHVLGSTLTFTACCSRLALSSLKRSGSGASDTFAEKQRWLERHMTNMLPSTPRRYSQGPNRLRPSSMSRRDTNTKIETLQPRSVKQKRWKQLRSSNEIKKSLLHPDTACCRSGGAWSSNLPQSLRCDRSIFSPFLLPYLSNTTSWCESHAGDKVVALISKVLPAWVDICFQKSLFSSKVTS